MTPPGSHGWCALVGLALLAGCDPEVLPTRSDRSTRYGVFRDLVWFPARPGGSGGYFLDMFESSQRDWRAYRAAMGEPEASVEAFLESWSVSGGVDLALPVVGLDLAEARAFARWRFGRLPRYDEWEYAATARGRYEMPWGNLPRTAYANTSELRFNRLVPVGMFESGRQSGGPYDLIGNAAEWTESVAIDWLVATDDPGFGFASRRRVVGAHPAMRVWWSAAVPLPAYLLVAVDSERVARSVARGADRPALGAAGQRAVEPDRRRPSERGSLLGVRVAADPRGILEALVAEREPPPPDGARVLRAFVRRHRDELGPPWSELAAAAVGPLAELLRSELGR